MKLINTEATRSYYAPFKTIDQLNANTKAIREQHSEFMTPSEKAVLDVIHRFASKHYGVCYLSKTSIAEKTGLSRRQVIRICNKFESLGFFVQYATDRRAGGGQTSNTIVFLTQLAAKDAFVAVEEQKTDNMQDNEDDDNDDSTGGVTPDGTGLDAPQDAKKDLLNTKDTGASASLIKEGLVTKLPKTLKHALAPFFDANELYEMTGVVYKAKASVDKTIQIEDNESEYYDAIISVMNGVRRGQVVNTAAVLYTAIRNVTSAIKSRPYLDTFRESFGF